MSACSTRSRRSAATARSLAWRLYAPPRRGAGEKLGLVVWLHPGGAPTEREVVGAYRARLAGAGLALLAPATSDPAAWSATDALKVEGTIEAAIARCAAEGAGAIDPRAVVMFGDTAGGQVAFALAARSPGRFAGIVTIRGYPMGVTARGRQQIWVPPPEQKDRLRFLLIVGEQEAGRPILRQLEAIYRARGFWASLLELPEGSSELSPDQAEIVARWMGEVASGRPPADPAAPARKQDAAARQATADRVLREMANLARRRPDGGQRVPSTQAAENPPWRVGLGAGWSLLGKPGPGEPAQWQLRRGQGEAAEPAAQLIVSSFQANGGLDQYLKAHLLAAALRGGYAEVHHRGKLEVGQRSIPTLLLSEHRLGRRPGGTDLVDSTLFTWEAFLPTDDPTQFVGLGVQWEQRRLAIDAAAVVLTDVQGGLEHIGGGPTSQPDATGVPRPDEIF